MARILIVEDEVEMALGLKDNFEYDGHEVDIAEDGEKGLLMALKGHYHLIILDLMLPKKSGLDVCKEVRTADLKTPIIMLTARGQEIDKVLGLELGADDYMTKPFSVRELLARVKAILRRHPAEDVVPDQPVQMGKLQVQLKQYIATDEHGNVELSHKEFEILKYFNQHKNETVSRDALLEDVWGYETYPTTRTVDNYILQLRKKIEIDPEHPRHIITVHGIGYKYID